MSRPIALIAVALLLLCPINAAFGADIVEEDAKKELAKLQGTWIMVSG
jgi:hypothetical protein